MCRASMRQIICSIRCLALQIRRVNLYAIGLLVSAKQKRAKNE